MQTPLVATRKKYEVDYFLIKSLQDGNTLICAFFLDKNPIYVALKITNQTKGATLADLRINGGYSAIGTHIGNLDYTTVAGEQRVMPLLEADYIKPQQ
jgi:hypothetical protein